MSAEKKERVPKYITIDDETKIENVTSEEEYMMYAIVGLAGQYFPPAVYRTLLAAIKKNVKNGGKIDTKYLQLKIAKYLLSFHTLNTTQQYPVEFMTISIIFNKFKKVIENMVEFGILKYVE